MGTTYNITLVNPPTALSQAELQERIDKRLQSLNQQMSTYLDDSEIIAFNRGPTDHWSTISSDFFQVILLSQEISAVSGGRFDITIGPLVELWGFGKQTLNTVPDEQAVADAKANIGWQQLQTDREQQAILKQVPLWLDVSAVAKGYGVDKVAELLLSEGMQDFLVEIGGEMRVKGLNREGQPWRIGIETPSLLQKQAQQLVLLTDKAIATSGDYRNYFEDQGRRYSHTIDPETGYPVRHNIASVTVVTDTAGEADALATALNVMGEEAAMALARAKNLAVYFILYDNDSSENYRIEYTPAFEAFLPAS